MVERFISYGSSSVKKSSLNSDQDAWAGPGCFVQSVSYASTLKLFLVWLNLNYRARHRGQEFIIDVLDFMGNFW